MRFRGLLIAVACLVALALVLRFVPQKEKTTEAGETKSEKLFNNLKTDDIQQITLQPASGEKVTLQRDGDKWKIADPAGVKPEEWAASNVASTLGSLTYDDVVADKPGSLKDFGLDPPAATVNFKTKTGAEQTLLIGETTPTGSSLYVKTAAQPRVVAVGSYIKSDLTKSLFDLRDKTAFRVDTASASHLWLKNKNGTIELAKNGERWELASPQARADQTTASDLLRQASDAKMATVEGPAGGTDVAKYGLNAPEITLKVQDGAGTHELAISADKSGKRYARSDAQNVVFTLPADVATTLSKTAADLRDKDVFDMDTFNVTHLDVKTPGAGWSLDKQKDNWKDAATNKTIDNAHVNDVIERLKAARANAFPTGPASKFGLDKPVLTTTVVWTASGKSQKESVEFGQAGGKTYARRAGEPAVYEVPSDTFKEAQDAVAKLK